MIGNDKISGLTGWGMGFYNGGAGKAYLKKQLKGLLFHRKTKMYLDTFNSHHELFLGT